MRIIVGLLTCLCICEWSQALATDPPGPASPAVQSAQTPPAATSAAAASATPAASSTPATATASTNPATPGVSAEDDKRLRAAGYKPTVQNGQTYYCKSEAVMGSRFEHKVCRTPEQVSADRNLGRDETQKSQIETYKAK